MLKIFGTEVTIDKQRITGVILVTSIPVTNIERVEYTMRWEPVLLRNFDVLLVYVKGSDMPPTALVNFSAQETFNVPSTSIPVGHEFNSCDMGHVTPNATRLVATGADGNAIVCEECAHQHFLRYNFEKLKLYAKGLGD